MAAEIFYVENDVFSDRSLVLSQIFGAVGLEEAPFFSYIKKVSYQGDGKGTVRGGFQWEYDIIPEASTTKNAFREGSEAPTSEHYKTGLLTNYNQILKTSYGMSGTAQKLNNRANMEYQRHKSLITLKKDVNKALITNKTGKAASKTVEGELIGLAGWFGTHNEIDAGSKVLSLDMIEALGILFSRNGINMTTLLMNSNQKSKLNKFYEKEIRVPEGRKTLTMTNINRIENVLGFNRGLDIIVDDMVADDDIIIFNKEGVLWNSFRELVDQDFQKGSLDADEKWNLYEGTLVIETPMSVGRIKNLVLQ